LEAGEMFLRSARLSGIVAFAFPLLLITGLATQQPKVPRRTFPLRPCSHVLNSGTSLQCLAPRSAGYG
jgi:hypothetical protein